MPPRECTWREHHCDYSDWQADTDYYISAVNDTDWQSDSVNSVSHTQRLSFGAASADESGSESDESAESESEF